MTTADAAEFLVKLISQLFHADELITEQAERIEALEAEVARLREALADRKGRPRERPPFGCAVHMRRYTSSRAGERRPAAGVTAMSLR